VWGIGALVIVRVLCVRHWGTSGGEYCLCGALGHWGTSDSESNLCEALGH